MSEAIAEQAAEATEASEQTSTEAKSEQAQQAESDTDDWQAKFEAQQKINRDLEAKLKKSAQRDGHARAKELEAQLAEMQAKAEGREAEYKAEQERRATEQQALNKANDRIRRSEVKAAAKGVLADPSDAYKFLDLESFEVDDDGNVDEGAIASALDDLVKSKPYLAAQGSRKFQGTADGGARKDALKPSQLTRADLDRMTPDEINEARSKGQLDDLMGIKR